MAVNRRKALSYFFGFASLVLAGSYVFVAVQYEQDRFLELRKARRERDLALPIPHAASDDFEFWRSDGGKRLRFVLGLQLLAWFGGAGAIVFGRRMLVRQRDDLEQEISAQSNELRLQSQLRDSYDQLKQTQAQLVHSEKMASLGMIAAGIAHEINNPLSYVLSNAEMLVVNFSLLEPVISAGQRALGHSSEVETLIDDSKAIVEDVLEGGNRIKDIVQGLRHFSRADEAEFKLVDLNECLETTLRLLSNELKHTYSVHAEFLPLTKTYCSPGQLIQVFTNLIVNSIQAMQSGGDIYVTTREVSGQIIIVVRDNGPGISSKDLANIFTPFFTTKPVGKGTGLGLSISYGIVQKHGGSITVKSEPGQGAQFSIVLPIRKSELGA